MGHGMIFLQSLLYVNMMALFKGLGVGNAFL